MTKKKDPETTAEAVAPEPSASNDSVDSDANVPAGTEAAAPASNDATETTVLPKDSAEPVKPLTDEELKALAGAQPGEMKAPTDEQLEATRVAMGDRYRDVMAASIARICHEVNRVYCLSLGDPTQTSWEQAPEWQRKSAIRGVLFHLAHPEATAAASHESWLAEKEADGWVYGLSKDLTAKTHPCFVPFESLPKEQQFKDVFFKAVVDACRPEIRETIAE